jgi:hypothetical protein
MGCPAMGFKSVDDFGGLLSTLRQAFQVEHSTSLRGHGHQAMPVDQSEHQRLS